MAVSRGSSNGVDWKDVAVMLSSFQLQETIVAKVEIMTEGEGEKTDMVITVHCWEKEHYSPEVKPYFSSSVKCSAMNLKTMESALLALLYRVDFQLAAKEFERVSKATK